MDFQAQQIKLLVFSIAIVALTFLFSLEGGSITLAQVNSAYISQVRVMETGTLGLQHPAGLAFSSKVDAFLIIKAREQGQLPPPDTDLVKLTSEEDLAGSTSIAVAITDPINIVYDGHAERLLILQPFSKKLVEVMEGPGGDLEQETLKRHDALHFGLQDPRGMTVDPASGTLYILDGVGPRIVGVEPNSSGVFIGATISEIDLGQSGLVNPRGVALDPASGHLHVLDLANRGLYELDRAGQVVAIRDLSPFNLTNPQAMVFAPSGDLTDDPTQMNLYLADGGQTSKGSTFSGMSGAGQARFPGRIVEMSLTQVVTPAAPEAIAALVRTTDTSMWSPPSPDPTGIIYRPPPFDTLLISDGEVNEMTIPPNTVQFTGDNLFVSNLTGTLSTTMTTLYTPTMTFSDEPTGVTLNPANGHLFFSDDTGTRSIYEVDPGADGIVRPGPGSDDTVTSFSTENFGSNDPEGVTFVSWLGHLFIVDGMNREVYQVSPGPNGLFDGVPPAGDDVVTSFDTLSLGINDPEGIAFNPDHGNLYIVGESEILLYEVTITGNLVQTINVSMTPQAHKMSGLAYAPSGQNPAVMNIYIVDRGVDNNFNPLENDGKMYEFTLPPFNNGPPTAVNDSDSTVENTLVTIDVAANDTDANGNLYPPSANTTCPTCTGPFNGMLDNNGDGTFDYDPNPGFTGVDNFIYEICDTGVPNLCDTAIVTVTVIPANNPPVAVDDNDSTPMNTPVTINVAANDTDPDGNLDPNSANSTCSNGSTGCNGAANGTLGDNANGSITYTPNLNFNGSDSFVYEICDTLGACDTATVNVTVLNDPPVAVDDNASTGENKPVTINVAANDFDPDGNLDKTTTNAICGGCILPVNGVLFNNGNGTFDYTPNPGFIGNDHFVYEICDIGALCDTAAVDVELADVQYFIMIPLVIGQ